MLEELQKLKKLQKCDALIYQREDELDTLPEENDSLERRIKEMENKITELRNGVSIQDEERKKREDILNRGEDKLKGITGKQSAIRNKDEYNALLREIDNIKRFNKEIEEEIAEIGREVDLKSQELGLVEQDNLKKIGEFKHKLADNLKRMKTLENDIEKMYDERDKVAAAIRPAILRKYERILESSKTGKAIAEVDNYICHGCNMTLPPQLYNNVLKSERIETCPNCQCILLPAENRKNDKKGPVIREASEQPAEDEE